MRVAVYTITQGRLPLTIKSFNTLRKNHGLKTTRVQKPDVLHHYVFDQASDPKTEQWLKEQKDQGLIHHLQRSDRNLGQNIAANLMLDAMDAEGGYDWILRWDDDALAQTSKFLKKLVEVGQLLIDEKEPCIVSPRIGRLKHPPVGVAHAEVPMGAKRATIEVVKVLGGICRLHPASFFTDGRPEGKPWRFNRLAPRGLGEAAEVASRVTYLVKSHGLSWSMVRVVQCKVDHAYGEDGQIKRYPEQFGFERAVSRHVGYGL